MLTKTILCNIQWLFKVAVRSATSSLEKINSPDYLQFTTKAKLLPIDKLLLFCHAGPEPASFKPLKILD